MQTHRAGERSSLHRSVAALADRIVSESLEQCDSEASRIPRGNLQNEFARARSLCLDTTPACPPATAAPRPVPHGALTRAVCFSQTRAVCFSQKLAGAWAFCDG